MFSKINNFLLILTLICYLKLVKTTDTMIKENQPEFANQILNLKEIVTQLDNEVELLHKGFGQQADIIYGNWQKDPTVAPEITTEIPINQSEKIQEFYNNFNNKLLELNNKTEYLLQINNNLLWNKTQFIYQIIESSNKCPITQQENDSMDSAREITNLLEKLDRHLRRCDILKEKLQNLNKQEEVLEKNSENLSNLLSEINTKLDSQNQYFENLEKQLPVIQDAGKTLDEYIIRKNEQETFHQRCRETGNCRHGHHGHHGGHYPRYSYH